MLKTALHPALVQKIKSLDTDVCTACPEGMVRPDLALESGLDTLGNYSEWEL